MNQILIKPIITEKSMQEANNNRYTFAASLDANKSQIASEAKNIFGVNVLSVRTVVVKGKSKRAGRRRSHIKTSPWKKAVIEVAAGQKIALFDTTEHAEKS